MKGTIVKCLEEVVILKFGKDLWKQVLQKAGLPPNSMFLPFSDVDDETVLTLIAALCAERRLSLPQLARIFGEYWVREYSQKLYVHHYTKHKTAKDFLLSLDDLHLQTTKTMKNAHPPRFEYEWKNANTLIMYYKSHRNLLDLAVGLIDGVGKFYHEELEIRKVGNDRLQIVFP